MELFKEIIGYESIKKEMAELCDIIKNKEKYNKIGASVPKGLLLHGEPGLGKTTLAKSFIKECGMNSYTLKKNKESKQFIDEITAVFKEAKENEPSIIFLDDMDKFANEDNSHRNAEEYVAVQTGIDSVKENEVFVIATTNELYNLPDSLIRSGRFDRKIFIKNPNIEDIKSIIIHYLKEKKVDKKLYEQLDDLTKIMTNHSCSSLEMILNEALIKTAFDNREYAGLSDFINAVLKIQYNVSDDYYQKSEDEIKKIAVHEAGHAIMAELLVPGSVGLVSIKKSGDSSKGGFMHACKKIKSEENIMISLAGKVAVELLYPLEIADGCYNDILSTCREMKDFSYDGKLGIDKINIWRNFGDSSDSFKAKIENHLQNKLNENYNIVKKILVDNMELLNEITNELMKKEVLLSSDINRLFKVKSYEVE